MIKVGVSKVGKQSALGNGKLLSTNIKPNVIWHLCRILLNGRLQCSISVWSVYMQGAGVLCIQLFHLGDVLENLFVGQLEQLHRLRRLVSHVCYHSSLFPRGDARLKNSFEK